MVFPWKSEFNENVGNYIEVRKSDFLATSSTATCSSKEPQLPWGCLKCRSLVCKCQPVLVDTAFNALYAKYQRIGNFIWTPNYIHANPEHLPTKERYKFSTKNIRHYKPITFGEFVEWQKKLETEPPAGYKYCEALRGDCLNLCIRIS
jgi:hypothetical protein